MNEKKQDDDVLPLSDIADALTFRRITAKQWANWKALMRQSPQWFVVEKLAWGDDRWRAIAGPFNDSEDAQSVLERLNVDDAHVGATTPYRRRVTSLTETIRIYRNNIHLLVDDLHESSARSEDDTLL